MEFTVASEIFERFPGMRIAVAVAHDLDNGVDHPGVTRLWRETWAAAGQAYRYANAQSHPRVGAWRERFRAMGVSGKEFPSSIEAMLRRAMKGGEPFRINPLVDFYNAVSLRHVVPAGGFDLDQLHGPLDLRLTRDGDYFVALDADAAIPVPPGEIAYLDGPTVLTRHFVWRQARTGLITPATRSVVLLSEVLGEVGGDVARQVLDDLVAGLRDHFGATPSAYIVDVETPAVSW